MANQKGTAEIRISKTGPNGKPVAEILVDKNMNVASMGGLLQSITRNKDLLKKVGLKSCGSCKSGFDINIRDRFEEVMEVSLKEIGG